VSAPYTTFLRWPAQVDSSAHAQLADLDGLSGQSGFPFTISVFGDTANAGTVVEKIPIRANYTGQGGLRIGTGTTDAWFNPSAFATPAATRSATVGRNTVYGPGMQTLDTALVRSFAIAENLHLEMAPKL